jgi:hypothetical protein
MNQRYNPSTLRVGSVPTPGDLPPITDPSLQIGDRFSIEIPAQIATVARDGAAISGRSWSLSAVATVEFLAASGTVLLGGAGAVIVPDPAVNPDSRFVAFAQNMGNPLTGALQNTGRTLGLDFTLASSAGAADAGVSVYWQRWETP